MRIKNTQSESSVAAVQPEPRGFGTHPIAKVRYAEFTPEEMAYDAFDDLSDAGRYSTIGTGLQHWDEFIGFRNGFVRLTPSLRQAFPDNAAVNAALESALKPQQPAASRQGHRFGRVCEVMSAK